MPKPIERMIFFNGGNFCAFRDNQQVPKEQGSAYFFILQDKLDRGVITPETTIMMQGWPNPRGTEEWTVAEFIKRGDLKVRAKK